MNIEKISAIPRNCTEWRDLVWSYCRDCCGRKRLVAGDCNDKKCRFYPAYSMPRQVTVRLDNDRLIPEIIDLALRFAGTCGRPFAVAEVGDIYYRKNGTGKGLNWGAIVSRHEWRDRFVTFGNIASPNERSHGDTVRLWVLR